MMNHSVVGGPLNDLEYRRTEIRGANYLVASAGDGAPVVLLHGFPETHYCWRRIIPILAQRHTVVATDLRGYGATAAPAGGPQGEGYSKRELAIDVVELADALGIDRFSLVGHDRGGRVAYRLALDHPTRVRRLAVVNVLPTLEQFERMSGAPSLGYWPWFLLAQPSPFPERLIAAEREHFLRFIFGSWTVSGGAIDDAAFSEYLRALTDATIASMCGDYRASFWLDRADDEADRRAGRRIACPVLVVTGAAETQLTDAETGWRRWAIDVRARVVPGGHFVPEEAPDELAEALSEFLAPGELRGHQGTRPRVGIRGWPGWPIAFVHRAIASSSVSAS
jgi:haloacetate dehalogenase